MLNLLSEETTKFEDFAFEPIVPTRYFVRGIRSVTGGACCFVDDPTCYSYLDETSCSEDGGTYQGDGSLCDPNPCAILGACCEDDGEGGTVCEDLSEDECNEVGGDFKGNYTTCDDEPDPCLKMGACCPDSGICTVSTEIDCTESGGSYQGNDTDCDPNPCPHGCCCGITSITVSADIVWTFDDFAGTTGSITASVGPVTCSMSCEDNNPSIFFCAPTAAVVTAVCDPTCEDIPPDPEGFCIVDGYVNAGINAIGCVPGEIDFSFGSSGSVFYCQGARWDTGGGFAGGVEGSIPCDAPGSYDFVIESDTGTWQGTSTIHVTVS